jgi:RNA polymerase sigma-70 factor (ECF subfamily)
METQHSQSAAAENSVDQIREFASGALQDAVSRYRPSLYRRAFRYVRDPHDAEDAVQDALLSAYKHLDQFKGTAKMTTWLTAIVTNSALVQLRRRPRYSHMSLNEQLGDDPDYCLANTLADDRPGPEHECASSESHAFLLQSMLRLSPTLRQAIQLRYIDGLSISEAARSVDVPLPTMKARVWRARTQLRQMMSGSGNGKGNENEL